MICMFQSKGFKKQNADLLFTEKEINVHTFLYVKKERKKETKSYTMNTQVWSCVSITRCLHTYTNTLFLFFGGTIVDVGGRHHQLTDYSIPVICASESL